MHILGISVLTDKKTIPEMLLLLMGPVGAGKTMYCKQFFEDGILDRDYCIYVNSSLTNKQFRTQFSNIENQNLIQNSKFINPYLYKCALSKQVSDYSISRYSPTVSNNKTSGGPQQDYLSFIEKMIVDHGLQPYVKLVLGASFDRLLDFMKRSKALPRQQ